ncbi:MAG: cysteine synthase A [Eubacterium sp.]|nr:cysteine synthase A [Eubacterium sp.]
MALYNSVSELIGNTPLVRVKNFEKAYGLKAEIYAKLQYLHPAGSVKDRIGQSIVDEAEASGRLNADTVIIEPTSGNTGIGLAAYAAAKGYKVVITMPESMSEERRRLMRAYGAELVLTPASKGMQGAVDKAEALHRENPNSIIAGQFTNPVNPETHYKTTGPEIYDDLNGGVDIFVAGVGTGGTLSGTGKYLKEQRPDVRIIAVEPASSPLLSKGVAGVHGIQGIGANFIPETLDTEIYDEIITVDNDTAFEYGSAFPKLEGALIGISGGAALAAAAELAKREENSGKKIVVLIPDSGDRYLSSEMFS